MPDQTSTPPRHDAGGRGQHRPFGRNGDREMIPADRADVNSSDQSDPWTHDPEAAFQADKLRDFVRRGGSARAWWRSKDFAPSMRRRIERAARELRHLDMNRELCGLRDAMKRLREASQ